jgi:hypothetical protein
MPCPRCQHAGLVRYENIIRGTKFSKLYYCGGCAYEWAIEATEHANDVTEQTKSGRTRPKPRS